MDRRLARHLDGLPPTLATRDSGPQGSCRRASADPPIRRRHVRARLGRPVEPPGDRSRHALRRPPGQHEPPARGVVPIDPPSEMTARANLRLSPTHWPAWSTRAGSRLGPAAGALEGAAAEPAPGGASGRERIAMATTNSTTPTARRTRPMMSTRRPTLPRPGTATPKRAFVSTPAAAEAFMMTTRYSPSCACHDRLVVVPFCVPLATQKVCSPGGAGVRVPACRAVWRMNGVTSTSVTTSWGTLAR